MKFKSGNRVSVNGKLGTVLYQVKDNDTGNIKGYSVLLDEFKEKPGYCGTNCASDIIEPA